MVDAAATPPGDWDEKATWSPSSILFGTPGSDGPPTITSLLNASGTIGTAFSYQITATKKPDLFQCDAAAGRAHVNTATGLISGTPTVSGSFSVNISATNAVGTDTKSLTVEHRVQWTAGLFRLEHDLFSATSKRPVSRDDHRAGCAGPHGHLL